MTEFADIEASGMQVAIVPSPNDGCRTQMQAVLARHNADGVVSPADSGMPATLRSGL